jgi:hypothetical protein
MKERTIILTESDIEEGIKTRFWQAVVEWLDESLDTVHFELEDTDNGNDIGIFKRLGGNAETLKRVKLLPKIFEEETKLYNEERK